MRTKDNNMKKKKKPIYGDVFNYYWNYVFILQLNSMAYTLLIRSQNYISHYYVLNIDILLFIDEHSMGTSEFKNSFPMLY